MHGSPKVLANIVLHGINGEINVKGASYKGLMPSFQQLSDAELAGVLTHIRSSWSNKNDEVGPEVIAEARKSDRTTPFESEAELKALDH